VVPQGDLDGQEDRDGEGPWTSVMEPEQNEKFEEVKTQKLFAKLPANYSALTPEEQAKWRSDLAQSILERARKS
jgi:hypothetical protein